MPCIVSLLVLVFASLLAASANNVGSVRQSILQDGGEYVTERKQHNVVFIMSDDQDLQLNSLEYMPLLRKYIGEQGSFFRNHFVTTALCCPSRVSLWTGRQAHNTNVTDVNPPFGGFPKFIQQGFNSEYLPVWLQQAGYDTYYVGKMFNWHNTDNYNSPHLAGFTGSDFLLDPYTYSYMNSTYQRNHDRPISYEGIHTSDVFAEKAMGFLDDAIISGKPFFIGLSPIAPHSNIDENIGGDSAHMTAPVPCKRHAHLFEDVISSGVNWISRLKQQDQNNVNYNDHFYRSRLRALQSTDELVESVIQRLAEANLLDDTYVIFTSDNGYHIGQHRLQPGKECGFEEDIRVPLLIRGPNVPRNETIDAVTTHIDLAPTIFRMGDIELREDFDGTPLPLFYGANKTHVDIRHEHVTVEYWGIAIPEGDYGPESDIVRNNTYKAVRIIGVDYNLYYSVWCTNEHELYDLNDDPFQMHNIYEDFLSAQHVENATILGYAQSLVIDRLDALLMVLKSCKGSACVQPWAVLHPDNSVHNLRDALEPRFNSFYHRQNKVSFNWCEEGYILDAEGPQEAYIFRNGLSWHEWV
ncbi:arylsulfatase-4 [Coleophoma crateriformis]|uniref:Arylsulfatase n=1 Tax=Coleophoma crateriformis TaxID=565419 RepID=A0A3D8QCA8_9HELO|nr:arylsulfatase-4 [Coleophoma crateriformis]